jgi:hypothetical protein
LFETDTVLFLQFSADVRADVQGDFVGCGHVLVPFGIAIVYTLYH